MKELVEVIAKALVDQPDEVSVTEKKEGRTTVLELHVVSRVVLQKQSVLLLRQQQQRKTRKSLSILFKNSIRTKEKSNRVIAW